MPDMPKKPPRSVSAQEAAEEVVEELYRLAEIIKSPSGDNLSGREDEKHLATERLAELLDMAGPGSLPEAQTEHEWVLDVLQDLAQYAESRNLGDLNRLLLDARFVAAQMLEEGYAN
ncbi:hypothetical protein [Sedimentitalea nanhaiensis]|uniref:Uncharacterized protein n=1 Tax=Sedimentitalea nanhaiensis TaxID=999627 RepID=A0A1I7DA98_9RHOB|nr:hypothetical protein [Sedimentitalea nanhaiensis]SFU08544.1 hypothetical protein SAMN05216236_12517 [Sedimentitalea nanhaiensis]